MTSIVNDSTTSVMDRGDLESLTTTFGLVVVALLILLLVERELLRAFEIDRESLRARRLRFVTLPLLVMSAAIIGARLANYAG